METVAGKGSSSTGSKPRSVRRIGRALVILALAFGATGTGRAAHGPGCEDTWKGTTVTKTCLFAVRGLPLQLLGIARTASGMASVTVTASVLLPDGEHVLATCSASAAGYASCGEDWNPLGNPVDPFVTTAPLICRVRGTSTLADPAGYFGCFSWADG